jgi:hypothetical protein
VLMPAVVNRLGEIGRQFRRRLQERIPNRIPKSTMRHCRCGASVVGK